MTTISHTSGKTDLVFCTEGLAGNMTSSFKPPKSMHVNVAALDEFSGELCRHMPDAHAITPMCLLEVKKDPRIIDRCLGDAHVLFFNAYIMLPGSRKKEKVQVQMSKAGPHRIVMPIKADDDYTVVVGALEISHYVTRVGETFKLMLQMDSCTLFTFYKGRDKNGPQNIDDLHTAIFVQKRTCNIHLSQHVAAVKITLAHVPVERYSEKFLVSVLFMAVPVNIVEQYKASRLQNGVCLMVLHVCVCPDLH
jgi:hypothetical protein